MSALNAITGPGLPPFKIATTPVLATPVCTSYPSARNVLQYIPRFELHGYDSSGCSGVNACAIQSL